MSKVLVDRLYEHWADSMIQAVESWQRESPDGRAAQQMEDVIQVVHALPPALRNLWRSRFQRLLASEDTDIEETRADLEAGLAHLLRALELYREVAEQIERDTGRPVENLPQLRDDLDSLHRLRDEMLGRWPVFGVRELEEARAAVGRGEAVPVDDAFAEAAGISKDELHRQLEEHRRRRRDLGLE